MSTKSKPTKRRKLAKEEDVAVDSDAERMAEVQAMLDEIDRVSEARSSKSKSAEAEEPFPDTLVDPAPEPKGEEEQGEEPQGEEEQGEEPQGEEEQGEEPQGDEEEDEEPQGDEEEDDESQGDDDEKGDDDDDGGDGLLGRINSPKPRSRIYVCMYVCRYRYRV